MSLQPTHTCFDDAIDFCIAEIGAGNRAALDFIVVHGICLVPGTEEPYSHAWAECVGEADGQKVTFVVEGYMLEGERVFVASAYDVFVENMRPQKCTRYTLKEWSDLNYKHAHYGPWEPEYRALLAQDEPRVWATDIRAVPIRRD